MKKNVKCTGRDICPYTSIYSGHISLYTLTPPDTTRHASDATRHHQTCSRHHQTLPDIHQTMSDRLAVVLWWFIELYSWSRFFLPTDGRTDKGVPRGPRGPKKKWMDFSCLQSAARSLMTSSGPLGPNIRATPLQKQHKATQYNCICKDITVILLLKERGRMFWNGIVFVLSNLQIIYPISTNNLSKINRRLGYAISIWGWW